MRYQMGDSLGGLVFGVVVLITIILVFRIIYLSIRRRPVTATSLKVATVGLIYAIVLIGAGLISTEQTIPLEGEKCFDDWCATIVSSYKIEALGSIVAKGRFVIVSVRVLSEARGATQIPDNPQIRLVDEANNEYAVSVSGQAALQQMQGQQLPLDKKAQAGESYLTQQVFEVPADTGQLRVLITEGPAGLLRVVVGDEGSLFHKKTYFKL